MRRRAAIIFSAVFATALTVSCSPARLSPTDNLLLRLKNRGAVALSSDNPYLAANLLVSREMEASPELRGFIQHRGAPAAIEVNGGLFSPLVMHFFYPENREEYEFEDLEGTWVIRGPITIAREKMKEVAQLTRNISGDPKLAFEARTGMSIPAYKPTPHPYSPESRPTPLSDTGVDDPFLARLDGKKGAFSSPAPAESPLREPSDRPMSADQDRELVQDLLSISGPHPAETTPKGDVVHYVTYPGETLSMIARWYTFDRSNAGRIARINRLARPDSLNLGDSIVVPAYLVRNSSRLTEEAVKALSQRR